MAEKQTKKRPTRREIHEKKQGVVKEFVAFINKGNAVALAIGVIIGSAFGAIVTSINVNIISPLIALIVGENNLSESLIVTLRDEVLDDAGEVKYKAITMNFGAFIQSVIDFLLIAIILFLITKLVSDVYKHVDKLSKDVKTKVDAQLEKEFQKDEARRLAKEQAKKAKLEGKNGEEVVEENEAEETQEIEEVVEEVAPQETSAAIVETITSTSDEQTQLLKEIRDLLKASK